MEHHPLSHAKIMEIATACTAPGKTVTLVAGDFSERYAVAVIVLVDVMPPAEVHAHAADVFTILEGQVTFTLGGRLADGRETAPGEQVGEGIANGKTFLATVGDTVSIPRGVPHQMDTRGGRVAMLIVKVND